MKYSEQIKIRTYNCDKDKNVKISNLIDFMVETSGNHFSILSQKNDIDPDLAWIVCQWDIEIFHIPKYKDVLDIETFPTGMESFFAYRNWEMRKNGTLMVNAKSQLMILDLEKMRPKRFTKDMNEKFEIEPDYDYVEKKLIRKNGPFSKTAVFNVRKSDIDINQHVNNARYIDWLMELVDTEQVKRLRIVYKNQTFYKETVNVQTVAENDEIYFKISGKDGTDKAYGIVYTK